MVVGVSTACMYPERLEKIIDEYGTLGIKDIEIFFNTFSELTPSYIASLERQLSGYGMQVHAAHPFTSGIEPLMIFSEYERRIDDMVDIYKRYFEIMQHFGAKVFVFHGDRKESKINVERYAQRFWKLAEAALPYGVTVAQENISRCRSGSSAFLREFKALLGEKASFVYDMKQALRSGEDPAEVLSAMGERIVHVHANDHAAEKDCLLPGKGAFDFSSLCRTLSENKNTPAMIVEVYRGDYQKPLQLAESMRFLKAVSEGNL